VETARRTNADLLVVGTHAHSGLRARWLAGMHEQLVHHATQPVVVVPHHARDRNRAAATVTASTVPG
jgi:nucleotide-binding universal stress UspA family protein